MTANRTGNRTVVDVTYDDPRTGERVRERRVQEIPYDELDNVRNRELALVTAPRTGDREITTRRDDQYDDNDDHADDNNYYTAVRRRRVYERDAPSYPRRDEGHAAKRPSRRKSYDAYDSHSDSDSSRERRRRRHRHHHRRDSDSKSSKNSVRDNPAHIQDEEDEGRLWYSGKARSDGNFFEKNFDSSYDGIIAAAAGAAMGVVTARQFGGEKNKKRRTLGAAVAGAAALNAGENWYRVFTEEREEKKEAKEKKSHG